MNSSFSESVGNPAMFGAMAYKLSDVLMLLSEMKVLDHLGTSPCSAATLAANLNLQPEPLTKLLDLLVTANILESDGSTYYVPANIKSVLPMVILESQVRRWHANNQSLKKVLKTGIGADPLNHIDDEEFLGAYQKAMAASARSIALHLFRYGSISKSERVLDIGGADGALAEQLSCLMPDTCFSIIDREPVQTHFNIRMAANPNPSKFRFVIDNALSPKHLLEEAKSADTVIISNLLHLLPIAKIHDLMTVLKTCLPARAQLIIYDQFVEKEQLNAARLMVADWVSLGAAFDMHESDLSQMLKSIGYENIWARRFSALPGALVGASAGANKQ